jgi:MoaA/NifB/PqqE/SkfB family radical SAM enzyme
MYRTRQFPDKNYKATYINGKTIRFAINKNEPIKELDYPEFYDISITNQCDANCKYCYQDSKKNTPHYEDIVYKVSSFFSKMSKNERPFQIAYGGGEPTRHPEFIELLKVTKALGIVPNYTTNGMWAKDGSVSPMVLIEATRDYCGGVAVSCHPHLDNTWPLAASLYSAHNIKLNFHIIISDKQSIDYFREIYDKWYKSVETFVLLPYIAVGRATPKNIDYDYLKKRLPENIGKIAFGANFYGYLKGSDIKMHLYEPEMFSKYITLKDNGYLYSSSFSNNIIDDDFLTPSYIDKNKTIKDLKQQLKDVENERDNYFWNIDNLENEISELEDNLIFYTPHKDMFNLLRKNDFFADNLYDISKLEELIRLYKNKTLEELQKIQ